MSSPLTTGPESDLPSLSRGRVRAQVLAVGDREHLVMRAPQVVHVLPMDHEGFVYLVSQFRPAVAREILEAPAGGVDEGETPEQAAIRELGEETGLRARRMAYLGSFLTSPGITDELGHYFLAEDVVEDSDAPTADDDERITLMKVHLSQVNSGPVDAGASLYDAKTALLARLVIGPAFA